MTHEFLPVPGAKTPENARVLFDGAKEIDLDPELILTSETGFLVPQELHDHLFPSDDSPSVDERPEDEHGTQAPQEGAGDDSSKSAEDSPKAAKKAPAKKTAPAKKSPAKKAAAKKAPAKKSTSKKAE